MVVKMTQVPRINHRECCGCGLCALGLPEVFRMSPEGKCEAYAPMGSSRQEVQKIIDDCPCMAILWFNHN